MVFKTYQLRISSLKYHRFSSVLIQSLAKIIINQMHSNSPMGKLRWWANCRLRFLNLLNNSSSNNSCLSLRTNNSNQALLVTRLTKIILLPIYNKPIQITKYLGQNAVNCLKLRSKCSQCYSPTNSEWTSSFNPYLRHTSWPRRSLTKKARCY